MPQIAPVVVGALAQRVSCVQSGAMKRKASRDLKICVVQGTRDTPCGTDAR